MIDFKVGDKVKRVIALDVFNEITGSSNGVITGIDSGWISFNNKTSSAWDASYFELVDDWSIYSNTLPLSELSDERRGLLFNHWCNGGAIVDYRNMGVCPSWDPDNVYRAKQKSERELFIEAAKNSASLRARDGADTVYGELFDAGFKAPKVGE